MGSHETMAQTAQELDGKLTEIVVQNYADRTLVLVTQMGKIGNMVQSSMLHSGNLSTNKIQVSLPATIPLEPVDSLQEIPTPSPGIQLTSLLGVAPSDHLQTLHSLYASHVATIVWTAAASDPLIVSRKDVIVGIALQKADSEEAERQTFVGVMKMVKRLLDQK